MLAVLRRALAFTLLTFLTCAGMAGAGPQAPGPVMLTIAGVPGAQRVYLFDRADLEALRTVTYRTSTIWTEGVMEFRGVPLSELLRVTGVSAGRLRLIASNEYAAEIPVDEVEPDVPLVAYLMDGKPMALRDKGPLWVVYPFDTSSDFQSERLYTRSVWQLVRIDVLP